MAWTSLIDNRTEAQWQLTACESVCLLLTWVSGRELSRKLSPIEKMTHHQKWTDASGVRSQAGWRDPRVHGNQASAGGKHVGGLTRNLLTNGAHLERFPASVLSLSISIDVGKRT